MFYLSFCDWLKLILGALLNTILLVILFYFDYYLAVMLNFMSDYTSMVTGLPINYNIFIILAILECYLIFYFNKNLLL